VRLASGTCAQIKDSIVIMKESTDQVRSQEAQGEPIRSSVWLFLSLRAPFRTEIRGELETKIYLVPAGRAVHAVHVVEAHDIYNPE
jgi:hypothetical protein